MIAFYNSYFFDVEMLVHTVALHSYTHLILLLATDLALIIFIYILMHAEHLF